MNMYIIATISVVILLIAILLLKRLKSQPEPELPYEKKVALFSPAERSFYGVLKQVIGGEYDIFSQVRIADIIAVKKGLNKSKWQTYFNKINAKHVDFVICNPNDLSVVAVIELDDKTHSKAKAVETDKFKDDAFKAAGIPMIRFKAQKSYAIDEMSQVFQNRLGFSGSQSFVSRKPSSADLSEQTVIMHVPIPETKAKPANKAQDGKLCPKCSSVMVKKTASKGKHAGHVFLACSTFPKCKMIIPLNASA